MFCHLFIFRYTLLYNGKKEKSCTEKEKKYFLLLQLERMLNAVDLLKECLVDLQALLYGRTAVEHGAVITTADELTDTRGRHLGVLLCQIHRQLSYLYQFALTALAEDVLLGHTEMLAYLLENVVDRKWIVVHLDGTFDDTLSQTHVDIRVVNDRIGHERIKHTLQIADRAIGCLSDKLDNLCRNLQAVTTALGLQDVDAQLHVGFLQLGYQSAREACQQAILHPVEVYWRTVAGQDNLLAKAEQVVEDMEEGVECPRRSSPLLYVIDDEHVDGLVEIDEIVGRVATHGISVLHLEEACRYIEYALLWIGLLALYADSIDKVGLAASRRSIYKERIEGRLAWMVSDRDTHGTGQFIAVALNEVLESLLGIELRVKVLVRHGIEHRRRLVDTGTCHRCLNVGWALALYILGNSVFLVGHQSVGQTHIGLEAIVECPRHQTHVVLLQVLVDIRAWQLHQHCLLFLVVGLEDNGLEPRFEDLLCDVLLDEMEAVVPKRLMSRLHRRRYLFYVFICF